MASFFKKIVKTANIISDVRSVTNAVRSGNSNTLASTALSIATGQRNINDSINGISGFNTSIGSSRLSGGFSQLSAIADITAGFPGLSKITNLLDSAVELEGLFNQPIRLVERSRAEIFEAGGGRFDEIRSLVSNLSELNQYDTFLKNFGADLSDHDAGPGTSKSRIPNPLRNFSSYNYKITMGILSNKEYNNPETYRSIGFEQYIIKSSGGDLPRRTKVDQEVRSSSPGDAEYFIDDFTYESIVAPNPKTGVAMGTTFSFTVTEPYSMGNFIEALVVASKTTNGGKGYESYFSAPFCLRIDFVGWTDDEENLASELNPIFLPFMISDMDMQVSGQGTTYNCTGVAFNEIGLADHMNKLYTQIHTTGSFVHTVLQTGDKSLSSGLNNRVEKLEDVEILPGWDRFVICFPKTTDAINKYLATGLQRQEDTGAIQTFIEQQGTKEGTDDYGQLDEEARFNNQAEATANQQIKPESNMFNTLLAFAEDESQMNEIGLSMLIQDATAGGNHDAPSLNGAIQSDAVDEQDPDANNPNADDQLAKNNSDDPCDGEEITPGLVDKPSAALASSEFARTYEFNKGETITTAIEKVLLNSEFCKENAVKEGEETGLRTWFRIVTNLYIEDGETSESSMGRPPYICVYSIIPYKIIEAKYLPPNKTPKGLANFRDSAAKEYNYLYTGNNEDVLGFDINFDTAFMRTATANLGNAAGAQGTGVADKLVAGTPADGAKIYQDEILRTAAKEEKEAKKSFKEQTNDNVGDGDRTGDIRKIIAETFHDQLITNPSDLVTADLQIWGDPFFLPQEIGNYHPAPLGSSPNATSDGTMKATTGDVYIVVNFRTPFDYQEGGTQVEMPVLVDQFSGVFTVISSSSNFSGGKFTQTLRIIRQPGQDKTGNTKNTIGGVEVVPRPAGYQSTTIPDATKKQPLQELGEAASSVQRGVNQAMNLFAMGKNSLKGGSIPDIATLAMTAQSAVNNIASASTSATAALNNLGITQGNTASQAASLFSPQTGGFNADAFKAGIPDVKIPGTLGSGSFGTDLSLAINNALQTAVPAFGQLEVDFASTEGQLAILGADLQSQFDAALPDGQLPPQIEDKTEELKTLMVDVSNNIITPSGVA